MGWENVANSFIAARDYAEQERAAGRTPTGHELGMIGLAGRNNPMLGYERARVRSAARMDALNISAKQIEIEMTERKQFGIAKLSALVARSFDDPDTMEREVLKIAYDHNIAMSEIDPILKGIEQKRQYKFRMDNLTAATGALGTPTPAGMKKEVTYAPTGMTVKITPEAESEKAAALERVRKLRGDALNFRSKGMEEEALILERKADEEAEWFGRQQSGTLVMKDDQSLQVWSGVGSPPSQLTVGARTEGQKLGVRWENASQLINRTITALRPEYVGVEGYIKHNVLDRWVEQFLPGAGDPKRMTSRSLLSNTREALLRLVNESPDRFTVADRSAIVEIIDGLRPGNSYQNIVQTMNQIKTEFVSRERTWARNQGQLPEVWASSVEELTERVNRLRRNMQMDARIRGEDPSTTEERLEGIVEGWWEIWSTGLPQ